MSAIIFSNRRVTTSIALAAFMVVSATDLRSDETKTNSVSGTKADAIEKSKKDPPAKTESRPARRLSGAELYSMHCNRCHPERYPTERTAAQWKTIMLHMRVRANLPAEDARTILKYLQENSGR